MQLKFRLYERKIIYDSLNSWISRTLAQCNTAEVPCIGIKHYRDLRIKCPNIPPRPLHRIVFVDAVSAGYRLNTIASTHAEKGCVGCIPAITNAKFRGQLLARTA